MNSGSVKKYHDYLWDAVGKDILIIFKDKTEVKGKLLGIEMSHLNIVLEVAGKRRLYRGDTIKEVVI